MKRVVHTHTAPNRLDYPTFIDWLLPGKPEDAKPGANQHIPNGQGRGISKCLIGSLRFNQDDEVYQYIYVYLQ